MLVTGALRSSFRRLAAAAAGKPGVESHIRMVERAGFASANNLNGVLD